ncbi:MAG: CatA-like O-acetyltransferase [Aquincola sp.]|nr:CatA-like O-acetyltransferase [Aquincola sp.]MDH5330200.1 CatA-like O-acetyltransferase [Aquincola sp.]
MGNYLDIARWSRRDAFEYFRGFDKPYFNVCVRLDVAKLKDALPAAGGGGLSIACYFIALRLANIHESFRLRLDSGRVRVYDEVHGSTTVLRADGESFYFANFDHTLDYATFALRAGAAIQVARTLHARFDAGWDDHARIHFTTLPWLHFSSFSHARNWGVEDSIPKLAFGRADREGGHLWMPMSVEVHHALMDGLHVGRFVQDFEAALREPTAWLGVG